MFTACIDFSLSLSLSLLGDYSPDPEPEEENIYTHINISGVTAMEEGTILPITYVELYHHNHQNGDTLKVQSDENGNFEFNSFMCSWSWESVEFRRETYIKAVHISDSTAYVADPMPVPCKNEHQFLTITLHETGSVSS